MMNVRKVRVGRVIKLLMFLSVALMLHPAHAEQYYRIGEIEDVDLVNRVIVLDGEQYRLSTSLKFSSDRPGLDLVSAARPGVAIRYNASPDGRQVPITELHVFEHPPL